MSQPPRNAEGRPQGRPRHFLYLSRVPDHLIHTQTDLVECVQNAVLKRAGRLQRGEVHAQLSKRLRCLGAEAGEDDVGARIFDASTMAMM